MSDRRTCGICQRIVSKKNFARHQQEHHGAPTQTCEICSVSIRRSGWRKHINSQMHKSKENATQQKLLIGKTGQLSDPWSSEAQTTENSQVNSIESLLRKFLDNTNHPLSHLSSTYVKEIERSGGLSDLNSNRETKETQIWASLGLRPPMLFPAAECWKRKPSLEDYFADLLHGFSKHTTQIYSRGNPSDPLYPPPFHVVLRQLERPDASSTMYAINMAAESVDIKIPGRLQSQVPIYQDSNIITTTNITPEFSATGLHVDHGKHGITLLYGGCVKLWALYPLTSYNLEHFSAAHRSDAAFIELQGELEGGEFCIQTEDQAIYLPPGCIHSTYTLRGGLTPGIEFSTVECLEPTAQIWDLNSKGLRLCGNDCYPFLEAIIMGLRSRESNQRERALDLLCLRYKKVSRLKPMILSKVKQALPKTCPKCGELWAKH